MIKIKCKKCGKVMEAFTQGQADNMLENHMKTHKENTK